MSDSAKVVGLFGQPSPNEIDGHMVALFRELLARAEAGDIKAMAVAYLTDGGPMVNYYHILAGQSWLTLLGAMAVTAHQIEAQMADDARAAHRSELKDDPA